MNREPMVFSVAGLIAGFVLGYMVADYGHDAPTPVRNAAAAPASDSGASGATTGGTAESRLDPAEVRALTSLAEKEKNNVTVRVELGNLLMDHGQEADAARWYGEALAIDPTLNDVRVDRGACLVHVGKYDDAIAEFDEALKRDPAHKKALFNKGVAMMESGQPKKAVEIWDALLKRYPDDPQLKSLRSQIDSVRNGAGKS